MFGRLAWGFGLCHLLFSAILAVALAVGVSEPGRRATLLLLLAATALLGLLTILILAVRFRNRFGAPLADLADAAERLGAGQSSKHIFAPGRDEVARLARSFENMADHLATRIAQLEEDRGQLRTILSGMVEGVVALDAEQRVLFANDRAQALLEFPTRNPVGRRLWEVVRQRPLLDVIHRALAGGEPLRDEVTFSGATARSLTVHAARLPGPAPRGAVLVVHDTTELRRLERLRQDFVANVSHELKTPLSVIQVCVETLQDGADHDDHARGRFLDQIAHQAHRLHALLLDLLSLARIESGAELLDFDALPLALALRDALERHHTRAAARRQTLRLLCPAGTWAPADPEPPAHAPGEDVAVWADAEALGQILDNLLDNALKYTPDGGAIEVAWRLDDGQIAITVRDTGIGIPEADLPRIFERFYRVDKARSRELGGTGLGLSIVKHLAQAMNGSVSAQSRLGEGTTFTVFLPRAAPA
jgi:two-component system phosphate regulon sensor histidine kinase PhoR